MMNKIKLEVGTLDIQLTDRDIKTLKDRHKECDVRHAADNLSIALWGCGCCQEYDLDTNLTCGLLNKITEEVIKILERN